MSEEIKTPPHERGATSSDSPQMVELPKVIEENPELLKYWRRRYSLFSKYDEGIKLDKESWYSVIPEVILKAIAERCACKVIIDAYCGAGGNSIQFAMQCEHVIAIDPDPNKIELARHNADVYGVRHKISFIVADFIEIADLFRADVVFLAPPWGGPGYNSFASYNLESMLPVPLSKMMRVSRTIIDDVALYLPRNSNTRAFFNVSRCGDLFEIDKIKLGSKPMGIGVYYNGLVRKKWVAPFSNDTSE